MSEQPLDLAIPRFKTNEDRVNTFVNGPDTGTWTTSGGVVVPTIRKVIKDIQDNATSGVTYINNAVTTATAMRDAAQAARDDAVTAKNAAQTAATGAGAAAAAAVAYLAVPFAYINTHRPIDPVFDYGLSLAAGLTTSQANSNTVKLFTAAQAAVAAGVPLKMPRGSIFEVGGGTTLPDFCEFDANGSRMKLANGQNATQFYLAGSSRNARRVGIKIYDLTLDGNAQHQTTNFYSFAWWNVSDLHIENLTIMDFWATAMNGNDLDTEGTYSGNPWYAVPGGFAYHVAAAPYGEQTSDTVWLKNVKTVRTQDNLDFANGAGVYSGSPHATMWHGDQFVVGKVAGLKIDDLELRYSGQNGLAIQFCEGGRVVDYKGQLLARGLYLETCNDMDIVRPHLRDHMMINNEAGNTSDTFGIWMATGDQSYPGVPYGGCRNIRIRDHYIHNMSRSYSAAGSYKPIVFSGNAALHNAKCSVHGGLMADIDQDASSPYKVHGIVLEGPIDSFEITGNAFENLGGASAIGISLSNDYGPNSTFLTGGLVSGNRFNNVAYPIYGTGAAVDNTAVMNNSLGSGRANAAYPGGVIGTTTNL